jgi:hypothetical protein
MAKFIVTALETYRVLYQLEAECSVAAQYIVESGDAPEEISKTYENVRVESVVEET